MNVKWKKYLILLIIDGEKKLKKFLLLTISLILVLQITGCTKKNEIDTGTVVWRVAAGGNIEDMTNEMIEVWQKPLNELLKEKKASYQVKIIPFSNKKENKQIQDLKELKKMESKRMLLLYCQRVRIMN